MRHSAFFTIMSLVFALLAVAAPVHAQAAFTIPFAFESGGKKLPAGDYVVTKTGDAQVTFRQVSTGKETILPIAEALKSSTPRAGAPLIVFDETGAFEPSYTEYFTIYVVAEVWLSANDGYLIHLTKGAHKDKVVTGESKGK